MQTAKRTGTGSIGGNRKKGEERGGGSVMVAGAWPESEGVCEGTKEATRTEEGSAQD